MTQNIIDDKICEYTVEIMNKLGIKGTRNYQSKNNKVYLLPYNPYHKCVIKLLPLDILTNMPLAENFDTWIVDSAQENQGAGTLMLKHAKSILGSPIRLYTFQENIGARRFYERNGFQAIAFDDGSGNEENCPAILYEWIV